MPGPEPPPEPLPERSGNRESALLRGQFPRRLATHQLGPWYLGLHRLQLRGRCWRLRLTRAPPHSPAPLRGGSIKGREGRRGRPLAWPASAPGPGRPQVTPAEDPTRGVGLELEGPCGETSGLLGGERAGGTRPLPHFQPVGGGPSSGKLSGSQGGVSECHCCPRVANQTSKLQYPLHPIRDRGDGLYRSCPLSYLGITA